MIFADQEYLNRLSILPSSYGQDRLVLLPRDPYFIFAYWELSRPTLNNFKAQWGEECLKSSQLMLRLLKYAWSEENKIESFSDIALDPGATSWYIKVQDPDRKYQAELGWRLPEGTFEPILKSNIIRTPRDSISNVIDENWQLPDWKARRLYRRISLYHLSSPEFFRHRKQKM